MSATVFANGMSIACKVANGKTTAAMPDVCLSPPPSPAGPIPIPYPNTSSASDTDKGSKTVSIGGEPVMLKHQSIFKTSTGNEAATKSLGMGVVTHKIQGEAQFVAWSMDVKFEGENVPRHMDLMGHNEACDPSQTPPWIYIDSGARPPDDHPCREEIREAQKDCKKSEPKKVGKRMHRDCSKAPDCAKSMQCILVPKGSDKELCCSPDNTGHHLIEVHWVLGNSNFPKAQPESAGDHGNPSDPTVCADAFPNQVGDHQSLHDVSGLYEESYMSGNSRNIPNAADGGWNYEAGKKAALNAHDSTFGGKCKESCISSQLDAHYGDQGDRSLNPPKKSFLGQPSVRRTDPFWGSTIRGN